MLKFLWAFHLLKFHRLAVDVSHFKNEVELWQVFFNFIHVYLCITATSVILIQYIRAFERNSDFTK